MNRIMQKEYSNIVNHFHLCSVHTEAHEMEKLYFDRSSVITLETKSDNCFMKMYDYATESFNTIILTKIVQQTRIWLVIVQHVKSFSILPTE